MVHTVWGGGLEFGNISNRRTAGVKSDISSAVNKEGDTREFSIAPAA